MGQPNGCNFWFFYLTFFKPSFQSIQTGDSVQGRFIGPSGITVGLAQRLFLRNQVRISSQSIFGNRKISATRVRRPEWGINIKAQGKAKRRPGLLESTVRRPERAIFLVHFAPSGQRDLVCGYPGRRCALPWANLLKPVGLAEHYTCPPSLNRDNGGVRSNLPQNRVGRWF